MLNNNDAAKTISISKNIKTSSPYLSYYQLPDDYQFSGLSLLSFLLDIDLKIVIEITTANITRKTIGRNWSKDIIILAFRRSQKHRHQK